jgi:TolB-like protein/tetratricopeptide (TPR) repeat protein
VFNTAGDGFMLEFPTASGALAAAEEIAQAGDPPVRVGVHMGEVSVTESGDLLGHGVNVAARIHQLAQPGAVLVSGDVRRSIRGPLGERLKPQGSVKLDKMSEVVPVYALAPAEGGKAKGRRLDRRPMFAVGAVLVVVLLVGAGLWLVRGGWPGLSPEATKVAVLPFTPLSAGQDVRDVAAGIADELQSVLGASNVPTVSAQDAETLRGPAKDENVRRLGVQLLLDGTVSSDGKVLDARVRLEDPRHHATLWTADISHAAGEAKAFQAQVATRTSAVLSCSARALRPHSGLSDPGDLGLYLHACDLAAESGWGDDVRAVYGILDTLRQLTVRAPRFAPAHSDIARDIAFYLPALPPDQAAQLRAEATREARVALSLDPKSPDAFVALSLLRPVHDYASREKLLDQALAASPAWPAALQFKASFLGSVGRFREALSFSQRASAADPDSIAYSPFGALLDTGDVAGARAEFDRLAAIWPESAELWFARIGLNAAEGRYDKTLVHVRDAAAAPKLMLKSDVELFGTVAEAQMTRSPAAIQTARRALLANDIRFQTMLPGRITSLASLGLVDDAFDLLNRYQRDKMSAWDSPSFLLVPNAAPLQRDPRFMPLMARLGLVDYWRATGKWPDFCSQPGLPYDCKAEAAKAAGARHE